MMPSERQGCIMADGKVTISTALDNRGLKKGIGGIAGSLGGLKGVLLGIGSAVGVAFGVKALVDFGKASIELGSNVAEVQNVVDVAFGDMAYKMEEFANTSIEKFGMSQLSAKKTGSIYMAMATGMGMASGTASDMALELTGLTGDIASFFNISQELADIKLKSIFTGETETLKDLGVVMTQTNLDAYALSNGFGKTTSAMSQQELVMLRYAFVMDQLKLAVGDFSRTSDSWANQTRILSERWKEFMSIIGQGLITVFTPVVKVLNTIVSAMINMANTFNAVISAIFGGATKQIQQTEQAAAAVGGAISDNVEQQDALTNATNKTAKAQKTLGIDELNIMNPDAGSGGTSGGAGTGGAGGGDVPPVIKDAEAVPPIVEKIQGVIEKLNSLFAPSIKAWGDALNALKKPFKEAFDVMSAAAGKLWENGLVPLLNYILTDFIPSVTNAFSETFAPIFSDILSVVVQEFALDFETMCQLITSYINDFVLPVAQTMKKIFVDVFKSISDAWNEYGKSILDKFSQFKEGIREIWVSLYDTAIKPVFDNLARTFDWLWDSHLKPLWDNITGFVGAFAEMILTVWNAVIQPFVQKLVNTLGPTIANVINFIVDRFGTMLAVVIDVVSGITRFLKGLCEFITGVFTGSWDKAWQGIKDIFGGIWDTIVGIAKGSVNSVIDIVNSLIRAVANGMNSVIDSLNSISVTIPSWVPKYGGNRFGINLPTISAYQIPKLAQGAVIPPNREFLAVLGDQTSGTNIETPLDTMLQAFKAALAESEESGGKGDIVLDITQNLDGEVLYKNQLRIKRKRGYEVVQNPAVI